MILTRRNGMAIAHFASVFDSNNVIHGFSTRCEGLNMSNSLAEGWEKVHGSRKAFLSAFGLDYEKAAWARQVHGTKVIVVTKAVEGPGRLTAPLAEADALITDRRDTPLFIVAADCVPVLLWDPQKEVIGAAHAGWRGTLNGAAVEAVKAMESAFGSQAGDLRAGIGPSIGPCCYEVGEEVVSAFLEKSPQWSDRVFSANGAKAKLDLWEANRLQLREAGLRDENIESAETCTSCNTHLFYSERKEGRPSGRFGAVICLR